MAKRTAPAPKPEAMIRELLIGLGYDTDRTQNVDSLDFRDLPVWNVKAALEAAYAAGKAAK